MTTKNLLVLFVRTLALFHTFPVRFQNNIKLSLKMSHSLLAAATSLSAHSVRRIQPTLSSGSTAPRGANSVIVAKHGQAEPRIKSTKNFLQLRPVSLHQFVASTSSAQT